MHVRLSRWRLAGIGAAVVVLALAALLTLRSGSTPAVTAAGASFASGRTVTDLARAPWYGLRLLIDPLRFSEPPEPARSQPRIDAEAGILVDLDARTVLWQHNAHEELAPASTIKLLTAMVVLENYRPDALITVTQDALGQAGDETKMYLKAGDRMTVAELLTGLLTVSANDAADALAVDTVGTERFVAAMNGQAAALGLHQTHATSPVGLDDPRMHSSAYDLAVLAGIDVTQWPLVRQIVGTRYAVIPGTAVHGTFYMTNLNLLLSMYPAATGLKTGYTGNAGSCLVGMAARNGHHLISVVLNSSAYIYSQTRKLLDWGFVQDGLPSQLPTPSPSPSHAPPAPASPHH
ncbi:MAG: D-alanyl-D-alanine carboxypeptidase [Chloroflexi bacterium]|nr:MAG: D-alanyl-D-alanine carboxypeptidase [Chloroflexota bacterium]